MSVLSMVLGKKVIINLGTHEEHINLYICVIAGSGDKEICSGKITKMDGIASNIGYLKRSSNMQLKYSLMLKKKVGARQLVYRPFLSTVKLRISQFKPSLF